MALKYDRVMPMHKIPRDDRRSLILDGHPCQIQLLDGKSHSSDQLQQAQAELFDILQQREREFGYSPAIHVVYPDRTEAFLDRHRAGSLDLVKLRSGRFRCEAVQSVVPRPGITASKQIACVGQALY